MSNETTPEGAAYERYGDGDDALTESDHPIPDVREAHDAEDHVVLKGDPAHEDAKAYIALDESFPTSDAPGHALPGTSDLAPSSGYDEDAEKRIIERRKRAYALWEQEGRPEGRSDDHWYAAADVVPEPGTAPWTEGP